LVASSPSSEQKSAATHNLLLMIVGLIATALVGVGVLFLLFKKGDASPEELVEENLNSNSFSSQEKIMTASESQVEPNDPDVLPTTNLNTNQVNTNQVEQSSGMLVTPSSSLSKLDIVPELIEDLNSSDRNLRRKTIWELAQRADSRAMKPLVELMMDVDSQERSLILEAMTQIASRTLKPMNKALMLSLEDENSQVRQNAIRDLTRVYDLMSQVTKRLSQAVEDSDSQVQQTAKWALQQLNQMPEIPWQMTAMEDNKDSTNRV
jgi:flagellar basal body-associated protein FliL